MSEGPKLSILSAGAPKTGVRLCAEAYFAATGRPFEIEFATAPTIGERAAAGDFDVDVVVAPHSTIEKFEIEGVVVAGSVVSLGSVATGVAVRGNKYEPDLSTAEGVRQALLAAEVIIYNRASSGQHIEEMIERLGIAQAVKEKTVRTDTGGEAMERLAGDRSGFPIGFGQITEIKLKENLGIHLAGPLPSELAKSTSYNAGLSSTAANIEDANVLLSIFASREGQRLLFETGVA